MLLSKDMVQVFEGVYYKILGRTKRILPDKRWIPIGAIAEIAWYFISEPSKVLSLSNSNLSFTQLKHAAEKINAALEDRLWIRWKMPQRMEEWAGVDFIRVYRSKKNRAIKVSTKVENSVLLGRIENEIDYDIIKVIQWITDWDEETSLYEIEGKALLEYMNRLNNFDDMDKIYNMHFGGEYNQKNKDDFKLHLKKLIIGIGKEPPMRVIINMNLSNNPNSSVGWDGAPIHVGRGLVYGEEEDNTNNIILEVDI